MQKKFADKPFWLLGLKHTSSGFEYSVTYFCTSSPEDTKHRNLPQEADYAYNRFIWKDICYRRLPIYLFLIALFGLSLAFMHHKPSYKFQAVPCMLLICYAIYSACNYFSPKNNPDQAIIISEEPDGTYSVKTASHQAVISKFVSRGVTTEIALTPRRSNSLHTFARKRTPPNGHEMLEAAQQARDDLATSERYSTAV